MFIQLLINIFINIYESNLYIPIIASIFIFILAIKITKKLVLARKIVKVSKDINLTENTKIDFLLYYAIENNDIHSFLNILKYGANINTTLFEKDIETIFNNFENIEEEQQLNNISKLANIDFYGYI